MGKFSIRSLMILMTVVCGLAAMVRFVPLANVIIGTVLVLPFVCSGLFLFTARKVALWPKRLAFMAVLVGGGALCLLGSYPRSYYMDGWFFFMVAYVGMIGIWLSLSASSLRTSAGQTTDRMTRINIALVAVPFLIVLVLMYQVPMRVVAYLPLSAIENRLEELENAPPGKMWCGPYQIKTPAERRGSRLCFIFASDGDSYFVYCPDYVEPTKGNPGVGRNPGVEGHLFGNWYWVQDD
ncbi:MAG: hypothetical protein ACE361_14795 [Aureliella sp.]